MTPVLFTKREEKKKGKVRLHGAACSAAPVVEWKVAEPLPASTPHPSLDLCPLTCLLATPQSGSWDTPRSPYQQRCPRDHHPQDHHRQKQLCTLELPGALQRRVQKGLTSGASVAPLVCSVMGTAPSWLPARVTLVRAWGQSALVWVHKAVVRSCCCLDQAERRPFRGVGGVCRSQMACCPSTSVMSL